MADDGAKLMGGGVTAGLQNTPAPAVQREKYRENRTDDRANKPHDKLKVFISYSRKDDAFADELVSGLEVMGFKCTIDRHAIVEGENWQQRLGVLIADADTMVFIISPDSAGSAMCQWELDEATRLSKRIIPVMWRPNGSVPLPKQLSSLNYTHFENDSSFMGGLRALARALETDIEWLREHTRLLARALEWENGGRPANRLLTGEDVQVAKAWADRRPPGAPVLTPLHLDFLHESEAEDARLRDVEAKRQREMAEALKAREKALAETEAAQREAAEASRKAAEEAKRAAVAERERAMEAERAAAASRKQRRYALIGLGVSTVLFLIAATVGFFAVGQWREAESQRAEVDRQRTDAEKQREVALEQTKEANRLRGIAEQQTAYADSQRESAEKAAQLALLTQSRYLGDISLRTLDVDKDPATALLLALEGLPDQSSDDKTTRERQHWQPLEESVEAALRHLRERATLAGHAQEVTGVAISADGGRIVTGSRDGTIRIWDGRTFEETRALRGAGNRVWAVAMTPDGSQIWASFGGGLVQGWDGESFAEIGTLREQRQTTAPIRGLAVTPDGSLVISTDGEGPAIVWNAKTRQPITTLAAGKERVTAVAVTSDGARIITGSREGTIVSWSTRNFEEVQLIENTGSVVSLAVLADGVRVVFSTGDSTPKVGDLSARRILGPLPGHTGAVTAVAAAARGTRFITGSADRSVKVWDAASLNEVAVLRGHSAEITRLALSADGDTIISGGDDRIARVWSADSFEDSSILRVEGRHIFYVGLTADDQRILALSDDGFVWEWDTRTRRFMNRHGERNSDTVSMAVSPDGTKLLVGTYDGMITLRDASTFTPIRRVKAHERQIASIAFSADGNRVVTGSDDTTAKVWNAHSLAELATLVGHNGSVWSVAVNHDGSRILTGSGDGSARIWEVQGQAQAKPAWSEVGAIRGLGNRVRTVAMSQDGALLFASSTNGPIRVLDAKTKQQVGQLTGHSEEVTAMFMLPDGKRVVTGSRDAQVKVWDIDALREVKTLRGHNRTILSLAATRDGKTIFSGFEGGIARAWELLPTGQELIVEAQRRAPRCLTDAQRKHHHLISRTPHWCTALGKWPHDTASLAEAALEPALAHRRAGKFQEAIELLEGAIKSNPKLLPPLTDELMKAHGFFAWRNFEQVAFNNRPADILTAVVPNADRAVELGPNDYIMLDTRGHIRLALGNLDGAVEDFSKSLTAGSQMAGTWYGRGKAHELKGNRDAALADYRAALKGSVTGNWDHQVIAMTKERLAELGVEP